MHQRSGSDHLRTPNPSIMAANGLLSRSSCYPDAERQFGPKIASRDLERYRRKVAVRSKSSSARASSENSTALMRVRVGMVKAAARP